MAKLDYKVWKKALSREFYQNSVDAGSNLIEVDADREKKVIHIIDNGCGMDYDTIKEKLLVLGGSKKDQGSVGAFGKAKEILFFSWKSYRIRTQDWLVYGEGANYTIEKTSSWQDGTVCSIWIWDDEDFESILNQFKLVAKLFEVNCQINFCGDKVDVTLKRGRLVRCMDWADVYFDDSYQSYEITVRIKGQWMFNEWLSASYDVGKIVLEVHGDSTHVLTSNRDALKGEYATKFRELIAEFITETKSALDPDPVVVREKFTGTGKVAVPKKQIAEKVSAFLKEVDSKPHDFSGVEDIIDSVIDRLPEENITSVDMDRVEETVKRGSYWTHVDRFSFIGFQPDFHVVYEEGSKAGRELKRFLSRDNVIRLANAWSEFVKQVLLDIEHYTEFNVGFDLTLITTARLSKVEGEYYFYLNPNLLLSDCEGKLRWYSNKTFLREDLLLKAIHEVTHLFYNSHNEDFILKSEWIRARTWKSLSIYPKIVKECFAKY
jgi:hypothetical protein